jgi:hypothetical protein
MNLSRPPVNLSIMLADVPGCLMALPNSTRLGYSRIRLDPGVRNGWDLQVYLEPPRERSGLVQKLSGCLLSRVPVEQFVYRDLSTPEASKPSLHPLYMSNSSMSSFEAILSQHPSSHLLVTLSYHTILKKL